MSLPKTFTAGERLFAADLNDNFEYIAAADVVKQVVFATDTTLRQVTALSYADANIEVTLTPTSTDSSVLLIWSFFGIVRSTASSTGIFGQVRFARTIGASTVNLGASSYYGGERLSSASDHQLPGHNHIQLDSPATTDPVTYKGQFRTQSFNTRFDLQNNLTAGQLIAIEVAT